MNEAPHKLLMRVGHGFDAHRLIEGRPLIIGGVDVPFERGALGHSDADVLTHAVADAILGSVGLGDLGTLFPDTDEAYRDANSLDLLWICSARLKSEGYTVGNVDATVIVQQPRLAPHLAEMSEKLAQMLAVHPSVVSVKAKTSEGMGYTGDGSGIAAHAIVLVWRIDL